MCVMRLIKEYYFFLMKGIPGIIENVFVESMRKLVFYFDDPLPQDTFGRR